MTIKLIDAEQALPILQNGGIIAYPTEGVYGLGCDPFNHNAIMKLLHLKQRATDQGFILLISQWSQLQNLVDTSMLTEREYDIARKLWPGVTLIFPRAAHLSPLLTGNHAGIAIRMTTHAIAARLCRDNPLISTSANISGMPVCQNPEEIAQTFPNGIVGCVQGALGDANGPSRIYDILSGKQLR